jgi:dolichyl-phosphate beta-glucosyltransferase
MISIIIPAFNEEKRIGRSLEKLAEFLKTRTDKFEVIVVDDASTDNTTQVAKRYEKEIEILKVVRLEKSPYDGKGLAVNTGVLAASGDIVLFTDADFSTPIEEIDKLLDKLNSGFDIAIGSRAIDRSTVKTRQNFLRELMGKTFNILVRSLTVKGILDTQCGFKAFKMPTSRSVFEKQKIFDFGFDVDILFLAQRYSLKIAEVPVLWYNDPKSTVHPIKDSYKMFIDLLKIRIYHGRMDGDLLDKLGFIAFKYRTFWRFSIVGVSNTIVDYGMFLTLTRVFGLDPLKANPIAVETAIIWSFFWNNLWTFSTREVSKPLLVRFLVFQFVSLGGLALSQTSLLVFNKFFNIFDLIAKALTIPIVIVFNYLLNSRWTFRDVSSGRGLWYFYLTLTIVIFALYFFLVWVQTGSFGFFTER